MCVCVGETAIFTSQAKVGDGLFSGATLVSGSVNRKMHKVLHDMWCA